jgi:hypothetical protein
MNATELADEVMEHYRAELPRGFNVNWMQEAATMLRQQQAEIELLSSDNKHYRNMAVDFLRCREPYGWHCFIGKGKEKQDFLFINGKGASKPDASWDKVIPLYTHPVKELTDEKITAIAKEIFKDYKNFHHYQIDFARAVIKEVSGK